MKEDRNLLALSNRIGLVPKANDSKANTFKLSKCLQIN